MSKIVTVNGRGGLTLPKQIRERLGVEGGGRVIVEIDGRGEIVLRSPESLYTEERLKEFEQMNESPLREKNLRWRDPDAPDASVSCWAVDRMIQQSEPTPQRKAGFGLWKDRQIDGRKFTDQLRAEWSER